MRTAFLYATLLGLVAFTGCAANPSSPVATAGQVRRVLDCVEKPGVEPAAVLRIANDFAKVPGVLDVAAGRGQLSDTRAPTTLPPATITFIVTFQNEAARGRADRDPTYRHVRDDLLGATCASVQAKDITLADYLVSEQFTEETTAAARERRAAAIKQQNELRSQTK